MSDLSRDCRVRTPRYMAMRRMHIGSNSELANEMSGGSTPVHSANDRGRFVCQSESVWEMRENAFKFEIRDTASSGTMLKRNSISKSTRAQCRDRRRDAGSFIRFCHRISRGETASRILTRRDCFFASTLAVACAYAGMASDANPYDCGAPSDRSDRAAAMSCSSDSTTPA